MVSVKDEDEVLKPYKRRRVETGAVVGFDVLPLVLPFAVPFDVLTRIGNKVTVRRPLGLAVKRQRGHRPVMPVA